MPTKTPLKRLGRQKIAGELNSAAGDIDNAAVESIAETTVSTLLARRLTCSKTKNPSDASDLHRQEKRESVSLIVVICKFCKLPENAGG